MTNKIYQSIDQLQVQVNSTLQQYMRLLYVSSIVLHSSTAVVCSCAGAAVQAHTLLVLQHSREVVLSTREWF